MTKEKNEFQRVALKVSDFTLSPKQTERMGFEAHIFREEVEM